MDVNEATFGAQAQLADRLLTELGVEGDDGSHDRSHLLRVWRNATTIAAQEPDCDWAIVTAAVILHDCVAVEKNSPLRSQASRMAAARARTVLSGIGWTAERVEQAAHAIEAHSFSAGIAPKTLEARIVQDADRLDAIGAIGVARCFYIGGRLGSSLYNQDDPSGVGRELDDRRYALDHFATKLFTLAGNFQTTTGRALAEERSRTMHGFVDTLLSEIGDSGR